LGNASEEGEETRRAMSRRKLLGLAATAAAGLAATQLTGRAHAETGQSLILGKKDNTATPGDITGLITPVDGGWPHHLFGGLVVLNDGSIVEGNWPNAIVGNCPKGIGVRGESYSGHGVLARSIEGTAMKAHSDYGTGVVGTTTNGGIGVHAVSETGTALKVDGKSQCRADVVATDLGEFPSAFDVSNNAPYDPESGLHPPVAIAGHCPNGRGVNGHSDRAGTGVSGYSESGTGVAGNSPSGTGVVGFSDTGIGVLAISKGSPALRVEGKSSFSTVGSGTIPKFKKSHIVDLPPGLVTDKSHISVTLTSNPNVLGGDAAVSFIERDPANNRFTITLTKAVGRDTTFTYFIVEP